MSQPPPPAPIRFFFLVAGHETHGYLGFRKRCISRVAERIEYLETNKHEAPLGLSLPTRLRFLLFDVGGGEIKFFDYLLSAAPGICPPLGNWQPLSKVKEGSGGPYDPNTFASLRKYRKLTEEDYSEGVFKREKDIERVMSVLDIYKSVRRAPPGSLLELSFFGHAFDEGPVIVNTFDKRNHAEYRDPKDVDGRAHLDFRKNMGEETSQDLLTPFKNAFSEHGEIRVWGCNDSDPARDVVRDAMNEIPAELRETVEGDYRLPRSGKSLESVLKQYFRNYVAKTYIYHAAADASIRAVGALPGPGTEPDREDFQLMRIPQVRLGIMKFASKKLKIPLDQRGFAILTPATAGQLKERFK